MGALKCYQQPDDATATRVVLEAERLRGEVVR